MEQKATSHWISDVNRESEKRTEITVYQQAIREWERKTEKKKSSSSKAFCALLCESLLPMYLSAECALRCTLNRFSFSLYLMRVKNLGNVKCKLKSFATLSGASFFYFLLLLYISSNTISCCTATNRACLLLFHFSLLLFIIFNLAFKFVCLSFARGKSSTYVVLLWIHTNDRTSFVAMHLPKPVVLPATDASFYQWKYLSSELCSLAFLWDFFEFELLLSSSSYSLSHCIRYHVFISSVSNVYAEENFIDSTKRKKRVVKKIE